MITGMISIGKCEKCGSTDLSFVPVAEFKIKYCNNCEHEENL